MRKGGVGGANTKTGLYYEGKIDFLTFIKKQKNYTVDDNIILYNGKKVGTTFKKHGLYKYLGENNIDYKKLISNF